METFATILRRSENPVAVSMLLMLSWIASCDGEISDGETVNLRSIASQGKSEADIVSILQVAQCGTVDDLQLACEVLREISPQHRQLMLQMAIGMALEDGYLTTAEGFIIRFLADMFEQDPHELDGVFREMTGESFPRSADPSSIEWWESKQRRNYSHTSDRAANEKESSQTRPRASAPTDMQRLRDLATLGLDDEASGADVRDAYRRMAKVHHPDRFASLGPEAVRAAEISFRRIQESYERLV